MVWLDVSRPGFMWNLVLLTCMQTTFHSTSDRSLGVQHLNFHRDGHHSPSDGEESVVGTMGHHLPVLVGHVHIQVLHDRQELHDTAAHL